MQNEIEVVIRIPEVDYKHFKELYESLPKDTIFVDTVVYYIGNGIPLPKGHGRLIEDEFITVTDIRKDGSEFTYVPYREIEDAPTIIEADTESEG